MYSLQLNQTKFAAGGVFGMSMYQMQYLTTMAACAVPQTLLPLMIQMTTLDKDGTFAKGMTNMITIGTTAASFVAGNLLFPEPEKVTTVVYHLCNQTFAG